MAAFFFFQGVLFLCFVLAGPFHTASGDAPSLVPFFFACLHAKGEAGLPRISGSHVTHLDLSSELLEHLNTKCL